MTQSLATFRIATIIVCAAQLALLLYAAPWDDPPALLAVLPFSLWTAGPLLLPYLITRYRPRRAFTIPMMLFLAVASLGSAVAYFDAFFVSRSSTAGLIMIFLPLYQLGALLVVTVGCGLLAEWATWRFKRPR